MERSGRLKAGFNDDVIAEAKRTFDFFPPPANNKAMDTFTAQEDYHQREKVEELFADQKGGLNGAHPRT